MPVRGEIVGRNRVRSPISNRVPGWRPPDGRRASTRTTRSVTSTDSTDTPSTEENSNSSNCGRTSVTARHCRPHRTPAGRFSGDLNLPHTKIDSHTAYATTRSGPEPARAGEATVRTALAREGAAFPRSARKGIDPSRDPAWPREPGESRHEDASTGSGGAQERLTYSRHTSDRDSAAGGRPPALTCEAP